MSGKMASIIENKNHFSFPIPLDSIWCVVLSVADPGDHNRTSEKSQLGTQQAAAVLVRSKSAGLHPLLSPSMSYKDDQGKNLFL